MSVESAKAFIETLKTDETFARQVVALKDKEQRKKFVMSKGFDFTDEELEEVTGSLTDVELEAISGGDQKHTCLLAFEKGMRFIY